MNTIEKNSPPPGFKYKTQEKLMVGLATTDILVLNITKQEKPTRNFGPALQLHIFR